MEKNTRLLLSLLSLVAGAFLAGGAYGFDSALKSFVALFSGVLLYLTGGYVIVHNLDWEQNPEDKTSNSDEDE